MKTIIDKYIKRIKLDYPEDDKLMIDLQQFAQEIKEQTEVNSPICPYCGKYKTMQGDGVIHQLCMCGIEDGEITVVDKIDLGDSFVDKL